ncbi:MAG: DUF58 domain-containing protein [Deltaproteobacteria bacterium]|nr:DUF58 domain-containing protein [Deltaproteobacteria bacterium]
MSFFRKARAPKAPSAPTSASAAVAASSPSPASMPRATAGTPVDDAELRSLLKRVRQVELRARKRVSASTSGAWHSRFKGRGMAFSESRAFADGDDPRHVDWLATARNGDLFVKQFVEERELTLLLVLDVSGSMITGSRGRLRRALAAEVAAVLALSASRNQDKVGLVAFTDRAERLVRPAKGKAHVLRIIRDVLAVGGEARSTSLLPALETAQHLCRQRAIVVIVSDLIGVTIPVERARALALRHDVAVVEVRDPLDDELPDVGVVGLVDAETGRETLVDTADARVRADWVARGRAARDARRAALKAAGLEHVVVDVGDDDAILPLLRFLRRSARRAA